MISISFYYYRYSIHPPITRLKFNILTVKQLLKPLNPRHTFNWHAIEREKSIAEATATMQCRNVFEERKKKQQQKESVMIL